jgi:hypothetical protein
MDIIVQGSQFIENDLLYHFIGTNFWYPGECVGHIEFLSPLSQNLMFTRKIF